MFYQFLIVFLEVQKGRARFPYGRNGRKDGVTIFHNGQIIIAFTSKQYINHKYSLFVVTLFVPIPVLHAIIIIYPQKNLSLIVIFFNFFVNAVLGFCQIKKDLVSVTARLQISAASRFLPPLNLFFLNVNLFALQLKTV